MKTFRKALIDYNIWLYGMDSDSVRIACEKNVTDYLAFLNRVVPKMENPPPPPMKKPKQ